jgi:nicotinate-nucleotide adenylyltransferase
MRLGIFGGTFDPIHFGHLLLAECCREQCRLDAVWFLPAAVPPHKQDHGLTPAGQRVEMIELAIAGNPAFSVCRCEADRGGVNYTFETLARIREEDPSRELFFLMGADMLADLPNWRNPARVCELAVPVVVRRPDTAPVDFCCLAGIVGPERVELMRRHQVEMPEIGVSSTEIRRLVSQGHSIRYRTTSAVEMYIQSHGLYREPDAKAVAKQCR